MKKYVFFFVVSLLAGAMLLGCTESQQTLQDKHALLEGQKFSIASLNGTPFSSMQDHSQYIEFDDKMNMTGQICNRFNGAATLKENLLHVEQLAATSMLCNDEVNAIESAFFAMLMQGAKVKVEAETLTLSSQPVAPQASAENAVEGTPAQAETHVFVLQRENSIAE